MFTMLDWALLQVFVESLDQRFENVCELDLIFHVEKVHHIIDEICMGGMVLETNMQEILKHVDAKILISKKEVRMLPPSKIYLVGRQEWAAIRLFCAVDGSGDQQTHFLIGLLAFLPTASGPSL
jgi:hypothetical protein